MSASYRARVATTQYGRSLVAKCDLAAGTVVAKFDGPLVASFAEVPEQEVRYAILIGPDQWLIPHSAARFINHACDPNCRVNDELEVVTRRPVKKGDELTISYNTATPEEILPLWDERWSFRCQCGLTECRGMVNGWVRQGELGPGTGDWGLEKT